MKDALDNTREEAVKAGEVKFASQVGRLEHSGDGAAWSQDPARQKAHKTERGGRGQGQGKAGQDQFVEWQSLQHADPSRRRGGHRGDRNASEQSYRAANATHRSEKVRNSNFGLCL